MRMVALIKCFWALEEPPHLDCFDRAAQSLKLFTSPAESVSGSPCPRVVSACGTFGPAVLLFQAALARLIYWRRMWVVVAVVAEDREAGFGIRARSRWSDSNSFAPFTPKN